MFILIDTDVVDEPEKEVIDAGDEDDDNCDASDLMKDIGTCSIT